MSYSLIFEHRCIIFPFFKGGFNILFLLHCDTSVSIELYSTLFHLAVLSTSIEVSFIQPIAIDQSGSVYNRPKRRADLCTFHSQKGLLGKFKAI